MHLLTFSTQLPGSLNTNNKPKGACNKWTWQNCKRMLYEAANTKHNTSINDGLVKIAKQKSLFAVKLLYSKTSDTKCVRC